MKTEILEKLEQLAFNRSTPFCYGCYIKAPKGVCPQCHSDDLMRHLEGVGVEWGTDWVIKHILQEELTAVDTDKAFEDLIRSCYSEETKVGWLQVDTVSAINELDPVSWNLAKSEWECQEEDDSNIISFDNGSTYYWAHELESLYE